MKADLREVSAKFLDFLKFTNVILKFVFSYAWRDDKIPNSLLPSKTSSIQINEWSLSHFK